MILPWLLLQSDVGLWGGSWQPQQLISLPGLVLPYERFIHRDILASTYFGRIVVKQQ